MKPWPIRVQLAATNAVMLSAAFAVAGLLAWWAVQDSVFDTVDTQLRQWAETSRAENGRTLTPAQLDGMAMKLPAGWALRGSSHGTVLSASAGARGWSNPPALVVEPTAETEGRTEVIDGHQLRIFALPFQDGTVLEVGAVVDEFAEVIGQFEATSLLAIPVLVAAALAGGYWLSGRTLAPIERITQTAVDIGAQNLDQRLPLRGSDDELDRLSATLNRMFQRLEESFRRITQFTADSSHELRTPIAVMRGEAEITRQRRRTAEEYEAALDRIIAQSDRATRLIEDLLALARADVGPAVMPEAIDVADILRRACSEGAVVCGAAGVDFSATIPAHLPGSGDPDALHRLFLTLIENAAKFTPPGGRVTVSLTTSGSSACVEVRDTGVGIADDQLRLIFNRFYRVSADRSRTTGGAGLGLAIAQGIASMHGGAIDVRSESGKGSVFRVRLPVSTAEVAAAFSASSGSAIDDSDGGSR